MIPEARLLHTMLRVADLGRALTFYTGLLGMRLLRLETYPEGRFTLAFIGYGPESETSVIELTHNWDQHHYAAGTGFGHIALGVQDLNTTMAALEAAGVTVLRAPGPMAAISPERTARGLSPEKIAFIADPDGYRLELIEILP